MRNHENDVISTGQNANVIDFLLIPVRNFVCMSY